ncbi:hypothetical protein BLA29_011120, partial [Euroglyphus maynei]
MDEQAIIKLGNTKSFLKEQIQIEYSKLKTEAESRVNLAELDGQLDIESRGWKIFGNDNKIEKYFRNRKLKHQAKKNIQREIETNPEVFWEPLMNSDKIRAPQVKPFIDPDMPIPMMENESSVAKFYHKIQSSFSHFWKKRMPSTTDTMETVGDLGVRMVDIGSKTVSIGRKAIETATPIVESAASGTLRALETAAPIVGS